MKQDIKNYTLVQLEQVLKENTLPCYSARQVFNWIYKNRVEDFSQMTNLSQQSKRFLNNNFYFSTLKSLKKQLSSDGTQKFLFRLKDRLHIETVFIPQGKRATLCVSTQVGCRFNCLFCMSGKGGFKRNLTVAEIINQYLTVADYVAPHRITNIVFMGIGEPLDNFDNTVKAIQILTEPYGLHFGKSKICISTSGIIPRIKDLVNLKLGIKLSVSLHSADDSVRTKLMPINRKYPLKDLIKVLKQFSRSHRYPVMFEYVLIKGINTSRQDALKLAKLLRGMSCKLNLIPYNSSSLSHKAPSDREIEEFKQELKTRGIFFTFRRSRGQDIQAACGQLRSQVV
jgi:23S rRNA (adenine2503-C2)-methyltransferase